MYHTPKGGDDFEATKETPQRMPVVPLTEEEAINKYIEDDIAAFELIRTESSEVASRAAMEENPCMMANSDKFDEKDAYGFMNMKATIDSLDQLETKHSEQPHQMSLTHGEKNAI
jgi:hypothetical protein